MTKNTASGFVWFGNDETRLVAHCSRLVQVKLSSILVFTNKIKNDQFNLAVRMIVFNIICKHPDVRRLDLVMSTKVGLLFCLSRL